MLYLYFIQTEELVLALFNYHLGLNYIETDEESPGEKNLNARYNYYLFMLYFIQTEELILALFNYHLGLNYIETDEESPGEKNLNARYKVLLNIFINIINKI